MRETVFAKMVELGSKTIIEKVGLIAYYESKFNKKNELTFFEILNSFEILNYAKPNISRLKKGIKSSRNFVKGKSKDSFRLSYKGIKLIEDEYDFMNESIDEIITSDEVLPVSLYNNTRGYIEKISLQINACYENNINDGCALLMRRLLEVLLILGYEYHSIADQIRNSSGNGYKNLSSVINYTVSNKIFNLSKDSYDCIDKFRKLGNFSAHRIEYNCRKTEITKVKMEYRVLIEELLYKSNVLN